MSTITYRGLDKRGQGRTGHITVTSVADWAAERHQAGWKALTIWSGEHLVGGISPDPETGERVWWGEK